MATTHRSQRRVEVAGSLHSPSLATRSIKFKPLTLLCLILVASCLSFLAGQRGLLTHATGGFVLTQANYTSHITKQADNLNHNTGEAGEGTSSSQVNLNSTQTPTKTLSKETRLPSTFAKATESPTSTPSKATRLPSTSMKTTKSPTSTPSNAPSPTSRKATSTPPSNAPSTRIKETHTPTNTPSNATQKPSNTPTITATQSAQHMDKQHAASTPTCNASQLRQVVAKSKWRYKTADELDSPPYGNRCRFIYARYTCDKSSTTANDMILEYSQTEMQKLGCHVPRYDVAMDQLIEKNSTIFLCGDSHIAQVYLDMLCTFQKLIHKVDIVWGWTTIKTTEVTPAESDAAGPNGPASLPTCHHGGVNKYWGVPALGQTHDNYYCNYFSRVNKEGESTVCTTFKKSSHGSNLAVVCILYTRPHEAESPRLCSARIGTGVPTTHGGGGESFRAFDTVVANTYIDQRELAQRLDAARFGGKYVMINNNTHGFPEQGQQMMISVDTANKAPISPFDLFKVDMSAFNTTDLSVQVLDTRQIQFPRLRDSHAAMYPITGHLSNNGKRQVCCPSSEDQNIYKTCLCDATGPLEWTNLRTCRNMARDVDRTTCGADGHLCLPGVMTDIVTNIFSVALAP